MRLRRIPDTLLHEMTRMVSPEDRDEMAMPSYLHRNPAMRWMAWRRVEVVAEHMRAASVDRPRFDTIMDFGCGTGVLLEHASQLANHVCGVDLVMEPATLLAEKRNLKSVTLMHPEQIPQEIENNSLDLIVAAEVLEHLEDDLQETLAMFSRLLTPSGRLIVSLPTESALYRMGRKLAGFSGHYHHDNASSIHDLILAQGFRVESLDKVPLGGPLSIYWVATYSHSKA